MIELKVNLDPLNPGQFFACCGLLDLLEGSGTNTLSHFVSSTESARRAQFIVRGDGIDLSRELDELRLSQVIAAKEIHMSIERGIRPIYVITHKREWRFDWWLTEFGDQSTELKCWAGQVQSVALAKELFRLLSPLTDPEGLFDFAAMTKSKFGIDPRSAWNALDFGYSPNQHDMDIATYPAVEVMGCLGLQSFRPTVLLGRKLRYALWRQELPYTVARLAAFMPWSSLRHRSYEFSIDKRGQSYKFFSFSKVLGEVGTVNEA